MPSTTASSAVASCRSIAGVYAVGHRSLTRHGRWLAGVLAVGDGAVLRRRSAAVLWRISEREPARIEIAAPKGAPTPRHRRRASGAAGGRA
jgi:hypothetical protein